MPQTSGVISRGSFLECRQLLTGFGQRRLRSRYAARPGPPRPGFGEVHARDVSPELFSDTPRSVAIVIYVIVGARVSDGTRP